MTNFDRFSWFLTPIFFSGSLPYYDNLTMTQGRVLQEAFSFHFPFVIAICFYRTSFFHTFPYDYNLHNPTSPYQFLTHPIAKKSHQQKLQFFCWYSIRMNCTVSSSKLMIHMQTFKHADWLRACQFLIIPSSESSAESWNWVKKVESECRKLKFDCTYVIFK